MEICQNTESLRKCSGCDKYIKDKKFCSLHCYRKWKRGFSQARRKRCIRCGEFLNRGSKQFCSSKCYGGSLKKTTRCAMCGEITKRPGNKYCCYSCARVHYHILSGHTMKKSRSRNAWIDRANGGNRHAVGEFASRNIHAGKVV